MRCIALVGPLAILLFFVAACGDGGPDLTLSPSSGLDPAGEGTWVLESMDGRPIIEESAITLRIGGRWIDGIDGCNSYGGRSEEDTLVAGTDGVFSIPPFGATDMLCHEPEGVMDQADAYVAALVQGERFRITGDRLEILDSGGTTRLVFVRRGPLPGSPIELKGTAWRLLSEGDAADGVRAPTLAFPDHRLVTGATACRSYVGTYRASEGALRLPGKGMLGSRQSWESCAENERTLEGEFTDFLTWAREYSIDEEGGSSRLTIWSIRGKTLTFEPLPQTVVHISDTDWSLVAFVELRPNSGMWLHRTTEAAQGAEVTMEFVEHGISGYTGCNSYGGSAEIEDGTVTVDRQSFFSTAKLCEEPDGLIEQEKRYLSLVQQATRYGIYGDGLFMQAEDDVFLLFQSRPPEPTPTRALPGRPPPIVFEIDWKADKPLITPGEPVTITLELKNVLDSPVEVNEFPATMTLTHVDTRIEESVPVEFKSGDGTPDPMEPGEVLAVVASVSSGVSVGLQSGRYRISGFQFDYLWRGPGSGPTTTSMNSKALFVVIPPEGVLDRVLVVDQAREADGARITLERIRFTSQHTTVSVFAASLTQKTGGPRPAAPGTATPVSPVQPGFTPTPASAANQQPWDGDLTDLDAFYRIDEDPWRHIANYSYREGPDGVHREWLLDPVSVNAETLEFAILPGDRPGSDGVFDYPAGDGPSPWKWTVQIP